MKNYNVECSNGISDTGFVFTNTESRRITITESEYLTLQYPKLGDIREVCYYDSDTKTIHGVSVKTDNTIDGYFTSDDFATSDDVNPYTDIHHTLTAMV